MAIVEVTDKGGTYLMDTDTGLMYYTIAQIQGLSTKLLNSYIGVDTTVILDMTDGAIFSAGVLTIPLDYFSIYNKFILFNNSGQTINSIVNLPPFKEIYFYSTTGENYIFQSTLVAAAVPGDIVGEVPVAAYTIIGRDSGGDFIVLRLTGDLHEIVETNIKL